MKNLFLSVIVIILIAGSVWSSSAEEQLSAIAPSMLSHTTREMKTPGFWISRHPSPDQVILEPDQINELNLHIQNDLKLTKDLTQFPETVSGEDLLKAQRAQFEEIKTKKYYAASGEGASLIFFQEVES